MKRRSIIALIAGGMCCRIYLLIFSRYEECIFHIFNVCVYR